MCKLLGGSFIHLSTSPSNPEASSAESVGGNWLCKVAESVKSSDFYRIGHPESVRLSFGQFRFVVKNLG